MSLLRTVLLWTYYCCVCTADYRTHVRVRENYLVQNESRPAGLSVQIVRPLFCLSRACKQQDATKTRKHNPLLYVRYIRARTYVELRTPSARPARVHYRRKVVGSRLPASKPPYLEPVYATLCCLPALAKHGRCFSDQACYLVVF